MTKYIVKDKAYGVAHYWAHSWACDISTRHKEDAHIFTSDELKNNAIRSRILLNKKRYVLIPVSGE